MRHPDLPTPPPGVKEPEWAFMLYGPGICGVCLCNALSFHVPYFMSNRSAGNMVP